MQYALVAGGSKGIGYAIAEALAKRRYNLILVARHDNTLQIAKDKLQSEHHVRVETIVQDLSFEDAAENIGKWCREKRISLKMLCNVAGLGGANDYLRLPVDRLRYMVDLNVKSCMALSLNLLPILEDNAPSYILNVGSMAGFAPIPVKNLYCATKSAIIFFSYSLRYQLKNKNISVSCLCPGPVFTNTVVKKVTLETLGWFGRLIAVDPIKVGEIAVRRTLNKRMIIVPGIVAKSMSIVLRALPRRVSVFVYDYLGGK